jgi:hypothetical protein
MMNTLRVAPLAVGCLLLAGCAGSKPAHSASPSPATSAATSAYVAAANAICTTQQAQLNKFAQPTTPEGAVTYLPHVLAIMNGESSRLAALQAPAADRAQLAAGFASERQLEVLLDGFLHKLQSGVVEVSSFAEVQSHSESLKAAVNAHFRDAGLAQCAA